MSYGHAAGLQYTQPPLSRLDYLVTQLGAWAAVNPPLQPLHAEFAAIARELREAGAGSIPAEIPPGTGQEQDTGQEKRS